MCLRRSAEQDLMSCALREVITFCVTATVVPLHAGETIGPGLFGKILKDIEMNRDEFAEWLRRA
jgi:hypothetical protein